VAALLLALHLVTLIYACSPVSAMGASTCLPCRQCNAWLMCICTGEGHVAGLWRSPPPQGGIRAAHLP